MNTNAMGKQTNLFILNTHTLIHSYTQKELLDSVQERTVRWKGENLKSWVTVKPIVDYSSLGKLMQGVLESDNMSCIIWAKSGVVVKNTVLANCSTHCDVTLCPNVALQYAVV